LTALDQWVSVSLIPLVIWVAISGVDDLFLLIAWLVSWSRRSAWPLESDLAATPRRRIAIFVPLWREHAVIGEMLRHNVSAIRYDAYDFFVGVYPNDLETIAAVREVQERFTHVHLALCPHDGPTTKADCLNWIYQRMALYEQEHGARFDIVVTHDAEDLIHPDSLRWINYFSGRYDMVQIPVLPLRSPVSALTHGLYCDEFAEYHTKDVPLRQTLGGFVPSCGVGTGFTREALEALARGRSNRIFEPACLTEDYENGLKLHLLGRKQLFVPLRPWKGGFLATREYFPRRFMAAVRQRTRWTIGISLQTWQRHGWRGGWGCKYWFWRDRKPLAGNLFSALGSLICLYGLGAWLLRGVVIVPHHLERLSALTLALTALQLAVRMGCAARVYGWRFASGAPLRVLWGNWVNCLATLAALYRFASARLRGRPLAWLKTEHMYPNREALVPHRRRLGEILIDLAAVSANDVERAAAECPSGMRLGEYLTERGLATETEVYEALSLQQNLEIGLAGEIMPRAVRSLPASFLREWRVLPYRIEEGALHVALTDVPSARLDAELRRLCPLEIRFRLIPPRLFEEMAHSHLPPA
jgi:adsorption protein B